MEIGTSGAGTLIEESSVGFVFGVGDQRAEPVQQEIPRDEEFHFSGRWWELRASFVVSSVRLAEEILQRWGNEIPKGWVIRHPGAVEFLADVPATPPKLSLDGSIQFAPTISLLLHWSALICAAKKERRSTWGKSPGTTPLPERAELPRVEHGPHRHVNSVLLEP